MAKKTVLLTAFLVSVLVIGVAPAGADRWDRDRSQHRIDTRRLESLSHRLERKVRHVRREAERRFDGRRHRGRGMLPALQHLERRAGWFHGQVERHPRAVRRLNADFRVLQESFRITEARMRYAHSRQLYRDVRQLAVLLGELQRELHRSVRIARNDGPRDRRDGARDWRNRPLAWNW